MSGAWDVQDLILSGTIYTCRRTGIVGLANEPDVSMGISVSNLSKVYGDQTAVDAISFEVDTGEVVGFLGPNGAGKSTTMRMLTCYLNPTSGTASVDGYDIHEDARAVRRRIGYLPEDTPLYTEMPVVEYLRLAADLQHVPDDAQRARIHRMMEVCGLGPERHKRIHELSKGFKQRVGLAQALLHDPNVLILDEPTTGLDPNQIAEIRDLIREVGQEKTVLLSSHILKEVEMTCDRVLIIHQGRLVADDTTDALRRRYRGGHRLRVRLQSTNGADVATAFADLDTIAATTPDDSPPASWTLDVDANLDDAAASVFRLCANRGWVLTELTPLESSLEDIFRELTLES